MNRPPVTKIERDEFLWHAPPQPEVRTLGKVYIERLSALESEHTSAVHRMVATHGEDPRDWPDKGLDELVRLDARRAQLEHVAQAARYRNLSWESTPAKERP